jgi:predicted TIM-barrel fold metal-dependent hydrolase
MDLSPSQIREEVFETFWDPTGDRLIKAMDDAQIDKSVILPLDYGLGLGEAKISIDAQNKIYAEIASKYPQRIIPFAGIDPRRNNAVKRFEKYIKEWGMKGLKIHPTVGYYPDDKICYPIYQKAQELGVPVLSHSGPIITPLRSKYAQPIHFDDPLIDFPNLQFIAAHLGFCWWTELAAIAGTKGNMAADLSGWQLTAREHYAAFSQTLRGFMDAAGSENLLFGTDNPAYRSMVPDKDWIQLIKDLPHKAPEGIGFTQEEVEAILGGNAQKLLNLQ